MYKMGLWEIYFYYVPQAYTIAKKTIEDPNLILKPTNAGDFILERLFSLLTGR